MRGLESRVRVLLGGFPETHLKAMLEHPKERENGQPEWSARITAFELSLADCLPVDGCALSKLLLIFSFPIKFCLNFCW